MIRGGCSIAGRAKISARQVNDVVQGLVRAGFEPRRAAGIRRENCREPKRFYL